MIIRNTMIRASLILASVLILPCQSLGQDDEFEKGLAHIKSRQYDEAIDAFSVVISMIPEDSEAYNYRGIARAYKKDYNGAIGDYTMALRFRPEYAEAFSNRGFAWVKQGDLARALEDFSRAIELEPPLVDAYNSQAWILATSADKRFRNGKKALDLAKKAVDISETVDSLDTLSAAYAAAGQFNDAVASQKRVLELMIRHNRADGLDPYVAHLMSYKAGKPLRITYTPSATQAEGADLEEDKPSRNDLKANQTTSGRARLATPTQAALPYTIQVSAYRDSKKAIKAATGLKSRGYPAFTCPVIIPGKGQWHRVFIGFFPSLNEARKAAARLKKRRFRYVCIAKKPLAVQVGTADTVQEARDYESRLRGKGYMAYSLLDRQKRNKTRILIGAYDSETEAGQLTAQLHSDGFAARVSPR